MSNLRLAGLGPIVGHTTGTSCRVWVRAGDPDDDGAKLAENRRTIGVAAIVKIGNTKVPKSKAHVQYFRLHREYDRTGTINLGVERGLTDTGDPTPLVAGTSYCVRVATLTLDDPDSQDDTATDAELAERLPNPKIWFKDLMDLDPKRSEASFETFPQSAENLSFIVGSCRYPGLLWKTKRADAIFGPLRDEAVGRDGRKRAEFVMMVGDQIYADMLNRHIPVGLADTYEEFQDRYISAFGSPHMRQLLREFPNYMILDDHEIEDNWSQDRIKKAQSRKVFNLAIGAYMSYQWSHGPRNYGLRLFYDFDCGGYPFFVLDTRTRRFMDEVEDTLDDNHLLGRPSVDAEEPSQLEVLLQWLKQSQDQHGDVPKFIVSSSVFAPNPISAREGRKGNEKQQVKWKESSDSWPAFPNTRRAILRCIIDNRIQNVIFVSGDIHCSNVAQIDLKGSPEAEALKIASITSSALYWPFPFADGEPSDYVHDSTASGQEDTFDIGGGYTMDYVAQSFTQEDNFCRVDIDRENAAATVLVFDTKGKRVRKGSWFGLGGDEIESTLQLAPW